MLLASPRSIVLLILNWKLWLPLIFFTWYSSMYVFLVSAVFSELHSLTSNLLCSTCWQCFSPILNSSVFLFVCANYCCCETCQGWFYSQMLQFRGCIFFFSCSIRTNLMRAFFFNMQLCLAHLLQNWNWNVHPDPSKFLQGEGDSCSQILSPFPRSAPLLPASCQCCVQAEAVHSFCTWSGMLFKYEQLSHL